MQETKNTQETMFPQKNFEQACFHSLGLLEQNCEYLEQHLQKAGGDENTLQAVFDMQAACMQLDHTINEMLELLACLHGTAQPELRRFDLSDIVQALAEQRDVLLRERGIELAVTYEDGLHVCPVYADSRWAEQISLHLLSNALHACGRGGHVQLILSRKKDNILFRVLDDGCGLPDGLPQTQLENRRHFLGGAQAGLLLCREYCRLMGWGLELCSTGGKTEAKLTIPAQLPCTEVALHEENEQEHQQRTLTVRRFLAGDFAAMAALEQAVPGRV